MTDLEAVRQRYRAFAEAEYRGYSDLYDRLSTGVADSDELVRFISARPVPSPSGASSPHGHARTDRATAVPTAKVTCAGACRPVGASGGRIARSPA
jgi:hypothetical protein